MIKALGRMEALKGFIQIPVKNRDELATGKVLPFRTLMNGAPARVDRYWRIWSSSLKGKFSPGNKVRVRRIENGYQAELIMSKEQNNVFRAKQEDKGMFKKCTGKVVSSASGPRAIEVAFPSGLVSEIGSNERYLHGRTPHSVLVWWARRPFTAMRAVIFSSLAPATSYSWIDPFVVTKQLASSVNPPPEAITAAQSLLSKIYDDRSPRVLDIFGGGGTIALEAARLGCSAVSLEINPLAHFIQRTILQYSQAHPDLPRLVREFGLRLLQQLVAETNNLYRRDRVHGPNEKRLAFFWGLAVRCNNPSCGKFISLSRLSWLSQRKGRTAFLEQSPDPKTGTYIRRLHPNPPKDRPLKRWNTFSGIQCPFCYKRYKRQQLQELARATLHDELLCTCVTNGQFKEYVLPTCLEDLIPSEAELRREVTLELERMGCSLPNTELPCWSGIINPTLYGIRSHIDLFNLRQLVVLLKTIRSIRELHRSLMDSDLSSQVSLAITSALSGLVDQLVDWNCRLSMWIAKNEQVGRALAGPGMPMHWDYVEIDPFSDSPANLFTKLDRIVKGLRAIPRFLAPVDVQLGSATKLPFEKETFDAVITDPPYGDNLFYSVLSECIYVWKRMIFNDVLPEIFGPDKVSTEDEIVAARHRHDSFLQAMEFYEQGFAKCISEATRVLRSDGIMSLFFSHSTIDAWEVVIRTFRKAGLEITAWWPMVLERRARPRGMTSQAINASSVIVARKVTNPPRIRDLSWVRGEIERVVTVLAHDLRRMGWNEDDIGLACFTKAASVVAMCESIIEGDQILPLRRCLEHCYQIVAKMVQSLPLQIRANNSTRHKGAQLGDNLGE